jgi:hypothetical protein
VGLGCRYSRVNQGEENPTRVFLAGYAFPMAEYVTRSELDAWLADFDAGMSSEVECEGSIKV